jgi:cytochrome P450
MTDTSMITAEPAASGIAQYPMPRAAGCRFDPPPGLRVLQREAPLTRVRLWDGSTAWLATRYADQRALVADPSDHPHRGPGQRVLLEEDCSFIVMDDPEHARLRRMVTATLAIKRVGALRPAIQTIVDALIDDMVAGPTPVDLVSAFALPVPSLVICELLGVAYADHDFFRSRACHVFRGLPLAARVCPC